MRICSRAGAALFLALTIATGARGAESVEFPTAIDAYRQGLSAHRGGQADAAVRALEYAAEHGILGAQLRLAKMYASGDGVPKNDAKAFRHYQRIADQYAEISPAHPVAGYVAQAFVALAQYYRKGVPETGVKPDPHRAVGLFVHAASYFGDPEAQFHLARMYLKGEGVFKDASLAVNWLANAIKKQHAPSQALLGDILWRGLEGVPQQPLKGLALLELARQNASRDEAVLVEPLYERAVGQAKPADRASAEKIAAFWQKRPQEREAAISAEGAKGVTPADAEGTATEAKPADVSTEPAQGAAADTEPTGSIASEAAAAASDATARPTAAVVNMKPAAPIAGFGFQNVGAKGQSATQ